MNTVPIAKPDMHRPKHKVYRFSDKPIIAHPNTKGIVVYKMVDFRPHVSINKPDSRAPTGFDNTPKLAEDKLIKFR